jgi:hypothetical protein
MTVVAAIITEHGLLQEFRHVLHDRASFFRTFPSQLSLTSTFSLSQSGIGNDHNFIEQSYPRDQESHPIHRSCLWVLCSLDDPDSVPHEFDMKHKLKNKAIILRILCHLIKEDE